MYAPLRVMKQIENLVHILEDPSCAQEINRKSLEFFESWDKDYADQMFFAATVIRNNIKTHMPKELRTACKKAIRLSMEEYDNKLEIECSSRREYTQQILQSLLYNEWSKAKRVYRFSDVLGMQLETMKRPKTIDLDVILKLPSQCFYLDYTDTHVFDDNFLGTFVQCRIIDNKWVASFMHCIDGKLISYVTCGMCLVNMDDHKCHLPWDDMDLKQDYVITAGKTIVWDGRRFFDFFVNFCLYLSVVNKDVVYTERTRQSYRPPKTGQKPENKMREVEEFAVGYKYSTVGGNKTRIKYVGEAESNGSKRPYSSNWRSAHYQHYWINDPDNPGEKKRISKWKLETFVQGNIEYSDIHIHKVTKEIPEGRL